MTEANRILLGVNVDHVATLRQARGTRYPDPVKAALDAEEAGADGITVHLEAFGEDTSSLSDTLVRIRAADAVSGVAINPGTDVSSIDGVLEQADQVLVMSVEPGFGGQAFMPIALETLRLLDARRYPDTTLAVDGGIGPTTISDAYQAGARMFVAGSSVFDRPDYTAAISELKATATEAEGV